MPVTIGRLTSNVDMLDSDGVLNDAAVEKIIRLVMARLKEEKRFEEQARQDREIRDRMSDREPF